MILDKKIQDQWRQFFLENKEVQSARLYGSRARGDAHEKSDVDLCISAPQITQARWLEIASFLEEQTASLLTVNVVRWENTATELKRNIVKEGQTLYERDKN